ncbi:fumarylacetoacetate hydrolase family protein [Microbacterium album]|uniref:Fumarylacetoacetase-like C-terminal domain-containing protein n=1 Tax=Microbacterium album TaxID=2053191 RepID=A0A917IHG1_9MICO|nr:fumarylacetoacetate hydrolase family protein [Microbacterium album]GGH47383.1 hypothetical protein GCM10010921_24060 [Microbacterium album]
MRIGFDARHGLVAIIDGRIAPIGAQAGVPADQPDPLLWALQHGVTFTDLDVPDPVAEADPAALRAPIMRPPKVIAAPVNYIDHKIEMSEQKTIAEYGVFLKASTSVIGPDSRIVLPYTDKRIDQEGELAVVIGRGGRHIVREEALAHVFGYAPLLDISVRSTEDRSTRKSYDTFTPVGPWITTADEIADPDALALRTWVNGDLRQHASTADLIFDVATLIEYASSIMTLEPGDVIATGTPAGVGPLADGDRVTVAIEGLGELSIPVTSEGAIPYSDRPGAL